MTTFADPKPDLTRNQIYRLLAGHVEQRTILQQQITTALNTIDARTRRVEQLLELRAKAT